METLGKEINSFLQQRSEAEAARARLVQEKIAASTSLAEALQVCSAVMSLAHDLYIPIDYYEARK